MPSRPDRPRAITPKVQAKILTLLRGGNYLSTACLASGIDPDTFYYWRKLAESGEKHAQRYVDFFGACQAVSAEAEAESLSTVRTGDQGWQGPAWFLARRFPKRWGKRREEPINQATTNQAVSDIRAFLDAPEDQEAW